MGFKAAREEQEINTKIEKMLQEQKAILERSKKSAPKKQWDEGILVNGGLSHYKFNNKWYRVSVDASKEDVKFTKFKFHTKTALGYRLFISAKDYQEAQAVVDDMLGKGLYKISGSVV